VTFPFLRQGDTAFTRSLLGRKRRCSAEKIVEVVDHTDQPRRWMVLMGTFSAVPYDRRSWHNLQLGECPFRILVPDEAVIFEVLVQTNPEGAIKMAGAFAGISLIGPYHYSLLGNPTLFQRKAKHFARSSTPVITFPGELGRISHRCIQGSRE